MLLENQGIHYVKVKPKVAGNGKPKKITQNIANFEAYFCRALS